MKIYTTLGDNAKVSLEMNSRYTISASKQGSRQFPLREKLFDNAQVEEFKVPS